MLQDGGVDGLLEAIIGGEVWLGVTLGVGVDRDFEGLAETLVGRAREEDDLAVSRLGHSLHSLEVSDLHGRSRAEDIGSLSHELGRLDLGLGGDDLAFTNTLALGSHGERLLELLGENDVLDEHALNLDTPSSGDILDNLSDGLGNLLAALNNVLEDAGTDDVAESGLGSLHKRLANVGNTKGGLVRADNVVVDDGGQLESDVVLGHANLLGHLGRLDLDVDLHQSLAERVDLDQTRVDSAVKLAELGDETDITLLDALVRVGAADAARDGTHGTNAGTEGVD